MEYGKSNKIIFFSYNDKKRYSNTLRIFYTNKTFSHDKRNKLIMD